MKVNTSKATPKIIKTQTIIGIDPDTKKSGVATAINGKLTQLTNLNLIDLCEMFALLPPGTLILIENVEHDKTTYSRKKVSPAAMRKIAQNVGAVKQTYRHICEFARHYEMQVVPVKPLAKQSEIFARAKVSDEAFNLLCKWEGRTNEEKRDAGMLALFGI